MYRKIKHQLINNNDLVYLLTLNVQILLFFFNPQLSPIPPTPLIFTKIFNLTIQCVVYILPMQ